MNFARFTPFLLIPLLIGCMPMPEQQEDAQMTCSGHDGALDRFVGLSWDSIVDEIVSLDIGEFATRERGKIYTQQFIAERTLFRLDAEGLVTRISCG